MVAYITFLPLHLLSLAVVFVGVILADKQVLAWVRGTQEILNLQKMIRYHRLVSVGFGLMILTGTFLFWPERSVLLHSTAFYLKMLCVIVLLGNSFVIGALLHIPATRSYRSLSTHEKLPLFLSGVFSTLGWVGAGISAFFLLL